MLEITDTFVMYKFSITPYMHLTCACRHVQVWIFLLHHLPIKSFLKMSSGPIRLGNDEIGLQYFNTKSRLKNSSLLTFKERFMESHTFNSHHVREYMDSKTLIGKILVDLPNSSMFSTTNVLRYTIFFFILGQQLLLLLCVICSLT